MDLQTLWFILIGVLFAGFLFLEGFDYGVGILLPFVAKNDTERRTVINSIGPVWDGNEVWLLTAGGAMFAAFPHWYATLFSGFYLALFLILIALIVRGVAFEFRSKSENPTWRRLWDWALFIGSAVPALLWGVAFANIIQGVAIDAKMNYVGSFFDLLSPFALVGGLVTLTLFILHGALFLELKTDGVIRERVAQAARLFWLPVTLLIVLFVILGATLTDLLASQNLALKLIALALALIGLLWAGFNIYRKRFGLAFAGISLTILAVTALMFGILYPRVLPSTLDPAFSLTIYNASSSQYTLSVMTVVALTLVPIVLLYQGWTYYVFRKRLTLTSHLEY
jgi:cytochrome d ubiquinol oxidase subunit II